MSKEIREAQFKVGDIVIHSHHGRPDILARISDARGQRVYIGFAWFNHATGDGPKNGFYRDSIRHGTKEERRIVLENQRVRNLTHLLRETRWQDLPLEALQAVVDLVKASQPSKS